MMDLSSWMFIFVMSAGCGMACMIIARSKGYRGTAILGWLAAGLIFSIFGLIAVILTSHGVEATPVASATCPYCGALLPSDASLCPRCGANPARVG
ncbi:MAG: zinc-ribbon domain-containing protein [Chlorobiaceae bacterium]|nr:zinc-ribbon domain-containing protein [Chlorobiaceae bacterium]